MNKLVALLRSGGSLLDIGCGSGNPVDVFLASSFKVTGVDISIAQIECAKQNVPDATFIHSDATVVEFPDSAFDSIISIYAIEHIPREEHQQFFDRLHRWLRQHGYFLLAIEANASSDVYGTFLGFPTFRSCFDAAATKNLLIKSGFEVIESQIEVQVEEKQSVPYLWVLAKKT